MLDYILITWNIISYIWLGILIYLIVGAIASNGFKGSLFWGLKIDIFFISLIIILIIYSGIKDHNIYDNLNIIVLFVMIVGLILTLQAFLNSLFVFKNKKKILKNVLIIIILLYLSVSVLYSPLNSWKYKYLHKPSNLKKVLHLS